MIAFIRNANGGQPSLSIHTLSDFSEVTVSLPKYDWQLSFNLTGLPNHEEIFLPGSLTEPTASGYFNGTILINASAPVKIFGSSYHEHSLESFLALPTEHLGKEYFAVTALPHLTHYPSQVIISAVDKPCVVEVFPTENITFQDAFYSIGSSLVINLDRYESAVLESVADITGTKVVSSEKISVMSGHLCARIPIGNSGCDMLMEQLLPYDLWGYHHTLGPFQGRDSGYHFRVIAGRNDTVVQIGEETVTLMSGGFVERDIGNTSMVVVEASEPVQVVQFQKGFTTDVASFGDPSITIAVPDELYTDHVLLYVYQNASFGLEKHFFVITIRCEWFDGMRVMDSGGNLAVI